MEEALESQWYMTRYVKTTAEKVPSTGHSFTNSRPNFRLGSMLPALTHERQSLHSVEAFLTHPYSVDREEKNIAQT
jgi:hypothetical protein